MFHMTWQCHKKQCAPGGYIGSWLTLGLGGMLGVTDVRLWSQVGFDARLYCDDTHQLQNRASSSPSKLQVVVEPSPATWGEIKVLSRLYFRVTFALKDSPVDYAKCWTQLATEVPFEKMNVTVTGGMSR